MVEDVTLQTVKTLPERNKEKSEARKCSGRQGNLGQRVLLKR